MNSLSFCEASLSFVSFYCNYVASLDFKQLFLRGHSSCRGYLHEECHKKLMRQDFFYSYATIYYIFQVHKYFPT